jgi:hypothetical protein
MNDLRTKLMEAARSHSPSDAVPIGFEKQVMAQVLALKSTRQPGLLRAPVDAWVLWTRTFLRATWSGLAILLILSLGSLAVPPSDGDDSEYQGLMVDSVAMPIDDSGGEIL